MGFGHGPFGFFSWGDNSWETDVLYDLVPQIYREDDPDELLIAWAGALGPSFARLRRLIRDLKDQRDPLKVQTAYSKTATVRLGGPLVLLSDVEQAGNNAIVNGSGFFSAPNARFDASSVGKQLTLTRSSLPGNNRSVLITSVIGISTVSTSPVLATDAGPVRWTLRSVLPSVPGQTVIELAAGDVSGIYPSWTLSDGAADYRLVRRAQIHPFAEDRKYSVEQEGSNGTVVGGALVAPSISISFRDVGKKIAISGSAVPTNNGRFEIVSVSGSTVTFAAPLTTDAGPLYWALWPREELTIETSGNVVPLGTIEQHGENLRITTPSSAFSATAGFLAADEGKLLIVKGSGAGNDGTYTIATVIDETSVIVATTFAANESSVPVYWEVRTPTTVGDLTQVICSSPSLIDLLAQDYGITVDTQEVEKRQRTWVASVNQWANMKGHPDSYEFLGKISGYNVSALPMYRIAIDNLPLFEGLIRVVTTVESGPGRLGSDGSLTVDTGRIRFSSPTAQFVPGDTNFHIRIQGSGSGNDLVFTPSEYINSTTLQFRVADSATTPDVNNGALTWAMVRYYGTEAVGTVLYDEINSDLLTVLLGADRFTVDKRCWDLDFLAKVAVNVSDVTLVVPGDYQITVAGANTDIAAGSNGVALPTATINVLSTAGFVDFVPGGQVQVLTSAGLQTVAFTGTTATSFTGCTGGTGTMSTGGVVSNTAPEVVVSAGNWQWIDSTTGRSLFLDTVPAIVGDGPDYTFTVRTLSLPETITGAGFLEYDCHSVTTVDCDYCKSNRILLIVSPGDIVDDPEGPATERAIDNRLLDRLKEVTPIHVQPVIMVSYVYDDFLRPDENPVVGPPIGGAYDSINGTWQIVDRELQGTDAGDAILLSDGGQSDATWELKFGSTVGAGGLVFRAGAPASPFTSGDYWYLQYDTGPNTLNLIKSDVPTVVATDALTCLPGDTLSVTTVGDSITVYRNGIVVLGPVSDSFSSTGTNAGVITEPSGALWSLLRVKPPDSF